MVTEYKTISMPSEGLYKEKGSKFIAHAIPVKDLDSCKEEISRIKQKYQDARHHCFAYVLGANSETVKYNDDGEPSNTAGLPILRQIQSFDLSNIIVIVIRYFGGIKLGTGGLIQAYKTATKEALEKALIVSKEITTTFIIEFSYNQTTLVDRLIHNFQCEIIDKDYQTSCILKFTGKEKNKTDIMNYLIQNNIRLIQNT